MNLINLDRIYMKETPIGSLLIGASPIGITEIQFLREWEKPGGLDKNSESANFLLRDAVLQLFEYFSGVRKNFDLSLDISRLPVFTKDVLELTRTILWGEIISYGELARRLGKPTAARAVGGALSRNPIPIIIPCHRVVASDGSLHGYSAPGGLAVKERLLLMEGRRL